MQMTLGIGAGKAGTRVSSGVLIVLWASLGTAAAQEADCKTTATGNLEIIPFQSMVFGNTRMLRVLLPPGYRPTDSLRYPVLYLNDGQNLFDVCTSIFNREEWEVDETVGRLIDKAEMRRIVVSEGGRHTEAWWAKRLPEALKFLFPRGGI